MKKLIIPTLLAAAAAWGLYDRFGSSETALSKESAFPSANLTTTRETSASDATLSSAYANRTSGIRVQGEGTVSRILPDDDEGSRHQRFLVRLASGQTVLIAHNIDLAQRVPALESGAKIAFAGEYEWNERGGVIHWTHHDPSGRHPGGWLRYSGREYR